MSDDVKETLSTRIISLWDNVTESLYPNYNTGENKREMDSLNFIQNERFIVNCLG